MIREDVMKLKNLLFIIFSMVVSNLFAQNQIPEEKLKSALSQIIDYSMKENYSSAAGKMLFDKSGNLRTYNADDKSELKSVKRLAKRIKAYLDLSDSYSYESITYDTFKGLSRAELKVNFKSGDQDLTISFYFVSKDGKILLQDLK